MSQPITTARQQLADALAQPGWASYSDMPESASAPGVLVGIASPYLEPSDVLGGPWWLRQTVWLLGSAQTNRAAREQLDQMIVTALAAIAGTEWCLDLDGGSGVEAPVLLRVGSDTYTAARVPVAVEIDLHERA